MNKYIKMKKKYKKIKINILKNITSSSVLKNIRNY